MNTQKILAGMAGAFLLITLLIACQKDIVTTDDALTLISQDAISVLRVDVPALMEKADFAHIRKSEMYLKAVAEAREDNQTLASVMENPETSGVDLNKQGYLFVEVKKEDPREVFTGFLVSLADHKQFETLVASEAEDILSKGPFKYTLGRNEGIVAWTKQMALFGQFSNKRGDLAGMAERVFDTKKAESIAQHKGLQKAFAEPHDLSLWFDSTPLSELPDIQTGLSLAEMDPDALKKNYISGYMDFLQGRIEGVADMDLQTKLTKDLDKIFKDQIQTDFSKYIPGDQVSMLMTHAINIRGIDEVLSARSESKGFLEFAMKEYDLTTKDLRETFGGDLAVVAIDGQEDKRKKTGLLATNILDNEKMDKILDIAVREALLVKEDENLYKIETLRLGRNGEFFHINFSDGAPRLLVIDDILFICGDEAWLEKLEKGGFSRSERLKGEIAEKSSKNLFYAYFDANSLREMNEELYDSSVKKVDFQIKRRRAELKVEMNEENMNALKAIFEGAEQRYEQEKGEDI